jgi:opacity protein-like surface antigen
LKEVYSDNVFKSPQDEKSEFITIVSPQLSFDAALAPKNYFSLQYAGDFEFHSEHDNLNTAHHFAELSWNWLTPKGSHFKAGDRVKDTASQPYSETDRSKDYLLNRAFAQSDLKLGAVTDLGLSYEFIARRYDDDIDQIDDYDRHTAAVSLVYGYFPQLPLLLEYRYTDQKNQEFDSVSRDYKTHTGFIGARWQAAQRLKGTLRLGYYQSDFDADQFDDNTGYAIDSDLTYLFSGITTFRLTASRFLTSTTRAERETGNYYVSEKVGFSVKHHYWERIVITAEFQYTRNDYRDIDRLDYFYRLGTRVKYLFRDWLSMSLVYWHRDRDSDLASVDYEENEIQALVTLSL